MDTSLGIFLLVILCVNTGVITYNLFYYFRQKCKIDKLYHYLEEKEKIIKFLNDKVNVLEMEKANRIREEGENKWQK